MGLTGKGRFEHRLEGDEGLAEGRASRAEEMEHTLQGGQCDWKGESREDREVPGQNCKGFDLQAGIGKHTCRPNLF